MPAALNDLRSLAALTADLQAPFALVRRAVDESGVTALLGLNGTDYFTAGDCDRIAAKLADIRQMTQQCGERVTMTKRPGQVI
jgi:hypothetical protein